MKIINIFLILFSCIVLYTLINRYLNILIDEKYEVVINDFSFIKTDLKLFIIYTLIIVSNIIYNLLKTRKSK